MASKILIIEDETVVLNFARTVLQHRGHDVLTASNLEEARAHVAANGNAAGLCLVVDVVLDEESGIAFVQDVIDKEPTARALLMSGYTDDVLIGYPQQAGRIAFLRKPFTREELVSAVDSVSGS